jgi:hypothetical protein
LLEIVAFVREPKPPLIDEDNCAKCLHFISAAFFSKSATDPGTLANTNTVSINEGGQVWSYGIGLGGILLLKERVTVPILMLELSIACIEVFFCSACSKLGFVELCTVLIGERACLVLIGETLQQSTINNQHLQTKKQAKLTVLVSMDRISQLIRG